MNEPIPDRLAYPIDAWFRLRDALENDEMCKRYPEPFATGFVRSVCQHLERDGLAPKVAP